MLSKKTKKSGAQTKMKGLKCFRTVLVICPDTMVKPAACAAPHRAQNCSHSAVGWGGQRWRSSCVFGFRGGMTERRGEPLEGRKKTKPAGVCFMSVHVSF